VTEAATGETPAIQWQGAVIRDVVALTPRIKSFSLVPAKPFSFTAGQHVDVRLTAPDGYQAMRSYSIASAPEDTGAIELAIERLKDGEVSEFFHDVAAVGDTIELRGPLGGYFVWPGAGDGPLLLVGGGSGVVPLASMIRHRHASGATRPVTLLYSARTWNDVIYRDELIALDGRNDGFHAIFTLTREPPARPGDYGRRVDAALIRETLARMAAPPDLVFVCGANAFVNAAADGVVAAGVPAGNVRTERYGE
jgi:ferredoxin-NADP reductase